MTSEPQNAKEIIRSVRCIEIRTRGLVEGLLQGAYHSVFKGRGIEFSEVREYAHGDDIRTIDWNVTARMNQPYVKEFIEERDLTVYILFDFSGSSQFGSRKSKRYTQIELAASLMFAAMRNNDNVGLVIFTDAVERFIPARKGRRHVLKLIRELIKFDPKSTRTDVNAPLTYISKIVKRKSIVFVLSDFIDEGYEKSFKLLSRRHDVISVNVSDPREYELPNIGFIELEDEETGEQILVDTDDPIFQENYRKLIAKRRNALIYIMRKLKVDLIPLQTDEPFELPLRRFFHQRVRRAA